MDNEKMNARKESKTVTPNNSVLGIPDPKNDPSSAAARIERIRYLMARNSFSQADLAKTLDIDTGQLSRQLRGKANVNSILLNKIVNIMGVSPEWLLNGIGKPYREEASVNFSDGTPVYDIDVTAGNYDLDQMFTQDNIIGYISLPKVSKDSVIVHVSGDSMEPEISNGTYIAIRPVTDIDSILYGQIYVVVTEDFRRVKHIRRDQANPDNVVLHSANPVYEDIFLNKSQIKKLFRVDAILNFKICV